MVSFPDHNDSKNEAKRRKELGQARAMLPLRRYWLQCSYSLQLLDAIAASPNKEATTDDIGNDLTEKRLEGGNWIGGLVSGLSGRGIIRFVVVKASVRAHSHRGLRRVWTIGDAAKFEAERAWLRQELERMGDDPLGGAAVATSLQPKKPDGTAATVPSGDSTTTPTLTSRTVTTNNKEVL